MYTHISVYIYICIYTDIQLKSTCTDMDNTEHLERKGIEFEGFGVGVQRSCVPCTFHTEICALNGVYVLQRLKVNCGAWTEACTTLNPRAL